MATRVDHQAEENIGMAMIYTLVSLLKEEATLLLKSKADKVSAAQAAESQRLEDAEQEKFRGTKVTPESFMAWHARFVAEQAQIKAAVEEALRKEQAGRRGNVSDKKLTGRQLFEGDKTLAESDAKYIDEGDREVDVSVYDRKDRPAEEEEENTEQYWKEEE